VDFKTDLSKKEKELDDYKYKLLEKYNLDKKGRHSVLIERNATVSEKKKNNNLLNEYRELLSKKTIEDKNGLDKQLSIPISQKARLNLSSAVPLFQNAQGAMLVEDGKFIIYALENPNVSTPLHELAHVFEHYLEDAERQDILKWAGHKEWTTETSEQFARGYEKYLADGKAPNSTLQKIFDKFKEWLTDIYNGIKGSEIDLELSPKMVEIYSKMLGKEIKTEPKRTFEKKQGKKSILNRLIEGDNGEKITKTLESLGKEYDVRNQKDVEDFALDFIKKVGIGEALNAVENGDIKNLDVKFMVYSEGLEQLKNEIDKTENENDREALIEKYKE